MVEEYQVSSTIEVRVLSSLVPRPLTAVEKIDFSPQLRDKIYEWPGNEARSFLHCTLPAVPPP